jgi:hypothetical protein
MRSITDDERKTATLVAVDSILSDVDDTETAFNDFRASFDSSDEPGTIKAWELQIDERGNVGTTKMQQRLGSWPIDAYKFDEICQLLINQYMTPDQHRMAVRMVGTRPGTPGYIFNKIVMLRRANKSESSSTTGESTSSIMKLMQEMNERNLAMFARLQQQQAVKPDAMDEIQKMMAFAQSMNAPMMGMLQSLLPALVGRPAPAAGADPFQSVGSLLDVAERLSDMRGGGEHTSGGDDNSFAGILRAIAPLAKPALEALPAIAAMQAANRPPARPAALVQQRPQAPASGSAPTAAPQPATAMPPASGPILQPTDIPSGDSQMLAQLKPQIDALVSMAEQNSDPTGAADLIFDQVFLDPNLPEELFEKLAGFVDSDTFVKYVVVMNPAAKPHIAWFDAFKTQVVKRLEAETTSVDQPTALGSGPNLS